MKTKLLYGELEVPLLALAIIVTALAFIGLALHDEVVRAGYLGSSGATGSW